MPRIWGPLESPGSLVVLGISPNWGPFLIGAQRQAPIRAPIDLGML
jgi:hypothetical protein